MTHAVISHSTEIRNNVKWPVTTKDSESNQGHRYFSLFRIYVMLILCLSKLESSTYVQIVLCNGMVISFHASPTDWRITADGLLFSVSLYLLHHFRYRTHCLTTPLPTPQLCCYAVWHYGIIAIRQLYVVTTLHYDVGRLSVFIKVSLLGGGSKVCIKAQE